VLDPRFLDPSDDKPMQGEFSVLLSIARSIIEPIEAAARPGSARGSLGDPSAALLLQMFPIPKHWSVSGFSHRRPSDTTYNFPASGSQPSGLETLVPLSSFLSEPLPSWFSPIALDKMIQLLIYWSLEGRTQM
jgi:hypothetical protein